MDVLFTLERKNIMNDDMRTMKEELKEKLAGKIHDIETCEKFEDSIKNDYVAGVVRGMKNALEIISE